MAGAGSKAGSRVTFRVDDPAVDQALRSLDRRVQELELQDHNRGRLVKDVTLTNSTTVPIYHGLNRADVTVFASVQSDEAVSTGRIEIKPHNPPNQVNPDIRNYVLVRAVSWGADITADLWIM